MQLKKLSQWSIIFFIFLVYFLFLFFFLLFLLFIFGNGNEGNFALNFIWTQMNIQLVFITFSTKKKSMATEYLNVRAALWLVLGKDHPSCQPLLQLEKIIASTMVPEGIRFTQGKELGQLNNSLPS